MKLGKETNYDDIITLLTLLLTSDMKRMTKYSESKLLDLFMLIFAPN